MIVVTHGTRSWCGLFPATNHSGVNIVGALRSLIGEAGRNVQKTIVEAAKRDREAEAIFDSLRFPGVENRARGSPAETDG